MVTGLVSEVDRDEIDQQFKELESEARARLRHEGVSGDNAVLQRLVSMRYAGQWRSLVVPMGSDDNALNAAIEAFHREHEREFAFRNDQTPVEIYQLQLKAIGKTPKPNFEAADLQPEAHTEPIETRPVYFEGQWHDTPVYQRERTPAGATIQGPAIINQLDSTTVVPPQCRAEIDEWLNIRIYLES